MGNKWADKIVTESRGFIRLVDEAKIPQRATEKSAGYDFYSLEDIVIPSKSMQAVKTGISAYMQNNEFLSLQIRSGLAFKHGLTLQNDRGVVDADYYPNEIKILIRNEGIKPYRIEKGERIAQGIFEKYLLADTDESYNKFVRKGGFGHTKKGEIIGE